MTYNLIVQLPAKSGDNESEWLPFWMHSKDTAGITEYLLDNWIPDHIKSLCGLGEDELSKLCRFIALTHDIGKLTPAFAARITEKLSEIRLRLEAQGLSIGTLKSYKGREVRHPEAGELILHKMGCPKEISVIIGAHHGQPSEGLKKLDELFSTCKQSFYGLAATGNEDYINSVSGRKWERLRKEWLLFALEESGYNSADDLPKIGRSVQLLLSGLIVMADWIASNTYYFPLIGFDTCGFPYDYPQRVEKALEKLKLPGSWSPMSYAMDQAGFENLFGFEPNAVQLKMLEAVNEGSEQGGIYILEAQMGVGKTEAALAAAEVLASQGRCGGVFFGLPTQATANGIFPRLEKWAERQSEDMKLAIRLAHGLAELNIEYSKLFKGKAFVDDDGDGGLVVHPWFSGNKQALLANFVIGTVDQLLLAALKQRHVMLRHLGLAGKVVIVDECHAYDAYMNQYLARALNWLGAYKVPVILLSATLPERQRVQFIKAYLNISDKREPDKAPDNWKTQRSYPLLTWTVGREVRQEEIDFGGSGREVIIESLDDADITEPLRLAVSAGGCCGIIVNTVRRAQELTATLKNELPEAEILLFHSRFTAPDRALIEEKLLKRVGKKSDSKDRRGVVVVGTQVLEQSLDIDFDMMITQLCPMDLLLQRLGRLHRHNRRRPETLRKARCYVLEADDGSRAVYGKWLLLRTQDLLPKKITLPGSIPELVQETYRIPEPESVEDEPHKSAYEEQQRLLKDKEGRARHYRIEEPKENSTRCKTIHGLLLADYPVEGVHGEAAVRDGEPSITVLVMRELSEGQAAFLPWQYGGEKVSTTHVPDDDTARKIAEQRLNLPVCFSKVWNEEKTIMELEKRNETKLAEWQNSSWLHGELVLLLNESMQTELCGKCLNYTREYGLTC